MTSNPEGIRIILAGYPRTGTTSLVDALLQLGYNKNYHGWTFMINRKRDIKFWENAKIYYESKQFNKINFDDIFKKYNYDMISDDHCVLYWKLLIKYYPQSKIILTLRNTNKWYNSHYNALGKILSMDIIRLFEYIISIIPISFCQIYTRYHIIKNYYTANLIGNDVWNGYKNQKNKNIACNNYNKYNKNVIEYFSDNNEKNRLFVLNWDKCVNLSDKNEMYLDLLKFLNISKTENEIKQQLKDNNGCLFPHINKTNTMKKDIIIAALSILLRVFGTLLIPFILYYLYYVFFA